MRNFSFALGVSLLLTLLTWLLLRGIDTNAPAYAQMLRAFDDYSIAEASLQRDVLRARTGLLRDYDKFTSNVRAMEDAVKRLRSYAQAERLDAIPVDRLAAAVIQQEGLMERFKTSNALLQNSLSFVGALSTSSALRMRDTSLAVAASELAAAILYLSRDRSSDALRALQQRIDDFAAEAPSVGPDSELARAMLAHARLLYEVLPAVDESVKAFIALPTGRYLEEARAQFASHRSTVEAGEQRYRLLLYLVSLLLLIALVFLGLRLRNRAIALRRRAALEHVIAENSTRLINCSPGDTDLRLTQVLAEFSRTIGADRAYVILDGNPVRAYKWCSNGTVFPPGWPDQALTVSEQLGVADQGITIPDTMAMPPGPAKDSLTLAGVRAWACVPLTRPGRALSIMAFDRFRPIRNKIQPMPIARLAGDAVANALEREFLERERAKLTMRLERARRMQMVGSLASGIAHNFNNIIGAILGYSEMIEPQLVRGTKPAQHVEEIRRAAERGRDLVDNILTFGRRSDARIRAVQVRGLLQDAAALLSASLPPGVELVIEDIPSDITVPGEHAQLQQVILNLCTNAAQAMEMSGHIRVTAKLEQLSELRQLGVGELSPGRYVCLSVTDDGRGFDDRVARRMFEPFFTTRLAGTGLGLATVREIVRDHDGAIGVRSEPGKGARFDVWLPVKAASEAGTIASASLPLGQGETVMIVESEYEHLLPEEEKLAALGYEPVGFDDAGDALAACRSEPDRFDIILLSYGSHAQQGLDLARAFHGILPSKPVLLAIASSIDVNVNALAEAGISEVLRWPLVSSELAAALAHCLRTPGMLRL